MGKQLDMIDEAIDVETIVMTRIVDACISIVRPYMVTNMDGPDPLPTDNPGFFQMAAAVYDQVRMNIGRVDSKAIIFEWQAEEMTRKELSRQENMVSQAQVEVSDVMIGDGKPNIVGVDE